MKPDYKKQKKQEKTKQKYERYFYSVRPRDEEGGRGRCGFVTSKDPISALEGIVAVCKNTPEGVGYAVISQGDPSYKVAAVYMSSTEAMELVEAELPIAKNDKERLELVKIMKKADKYNDVYVYWPKTIKFKEQ